MLIDESRELCKRLSRDLENIDDDKNVYETLFNVFYYALTGLSFTTKRPLEDARLIHAVDTIKKFLEKVFELSNKYKASLSSVAREVYRMAIREMRDKPLKYIVLCDGVSIIEALYTALKMRSSTFIGVIINPGGNTETYKFIIKPHEYSTREAPPSLKEIAQSIADEVGAEYKVFRGIDDAITNNSGKPMKPSTIISLLYNITSELLRLFKSLKRGKPNAAVMMISDHGYDVVPRGLEAFELQHCWSPRALSILAPLVVL